MTLSDGFLVSLTSVGASNFGSVTTQSYFTMGPRWKRAAAALELGSLSGTGNFKSSFWHAAQQPNNQAADWKLLFSLTALTASSAMSTVFETTSLPILPYGRFVATVESTNAGNTNFYNIVAKLLGDI